MTEASVPSPRKRGGQPGNRNRLKHGRWSRAYACRAAEIAALVRKADCFLVRVGMVVRARKALDGVKMCKGLKPLPENPSPRRGLSVLRAAGAPRPGRTGQIFPRRVARDPPTVPPDTGGKAARAGPMTFTNFAKEMPA